MLFTKVIGQIFQSKGANIIVVKIVLFLKIMPQNIPFQYTSHFTCIGIKYAPKGRCSSSIAQVTPHK